MSEQASSRDKSLVIPPSRVALKVLSQIQLLFHIHSTSSNIYPLRKEAKSPNSLATFSSIDDSNSLLLPQL